MDDPDKKDTPLPDEHGSGAGNRGPGGEPAEREPDDPLRAELAQKEAEAKEYYDRYLRERAELENFKRRTRREQIDARQFAAEELIRDLLPVVDNLERAVRHAQSGGDGTPLVEGVSLVLRTLEEVLDRHGVSVVDAQPGEPFDPSRHEALARQESEGAPNRVLSQHERGYFLHDRLLRAAKVVVSCQKTPGDDVEKVPNRG